MISNLSSSWDGLPAGVRWSQDQRFLKALVDINNATSSKTLFKDLYPVKLTVKQLVPGTVFVNATQDSGHAEWIAQTEFDGQHAPLLFYSSTVPQQVREFLVYPFMKIKWPEKNKNGFTRFRWPVMNNNTVQLTAAEAMSGYSLEQYELTDRDSMDFDDFVATRLIGLPIDGLHKLPILASHLADRIENRIPVVVEGFKVCGGKKCPDQNSSLFYDYSTYSRDGAILFLIQGIFELIYSNRYQQNVDDQMAGQMTLKWSQIQTDVTFEIQAQTLNLGQIVSIWNQALFSSDPNVSIEARWGIQSADLKTK